jgi:copper chaperone CopZ
MKKIVGFASAAMMVYVVAAAAEEPGEQGRPASEPIKATYLITGLHCPPCTRTVESSLRGVEGVRSVKVDWKSKNARIEFDESVLPAQRLAQLIAETPHMMGRDMRYDGWLALKVPELTGDEEADAVKEALNEVSGVKRVAAYPDRRAIGVQFEPDGELTTGELIEALNVAGFEAAVFDDTSRQPRKGASRAIYTCPMHPELRWSRPDDCPLCGMKLEAVDTEYYCPMHPKVVLPGLEPNGAIPKCPICDMPMDHRSMGMPMDHGSMGPMMCGCGMCMQMMGMGDMEPSAAPAAWKATPSRRYRTGRGGRGCGC